MTSFVTGATGFVGSHLCKALADKGEKVIALVHDFKTSTWIMESIMGCTLVIGDLRNYRLLRRVMAQYEVDRVFHVGALASVKTAYKDPIGVYETNVLGTVNILEACRQLDVDRTLVLITDKVFGERIDAKETDPIQASEPYATSKGCAQLVSESYKKTYNLEVIIARSCNIYGLDYANRIIPNTVKACLRRESPTIFEGGNEEKSVRQYIHIKDIVEGLTFLMNKTYPWALESYNLCTTDILNQKEVVLEILRFFPELKPIYTKRKSLKEISRQTMLLSDFGWKPKINFEAGIKDTIARFKEYGF